MNNLWPVAEKVGIVIASLSSRLPPPSGETPATELNRSHSLEGKLREGRLPPRGAGGAVVTPAPQPAPALRGQMRAKEFRVSDEKMPRSLPPKYTRVGGAEFLRAPHEEPWGQRTTRFFAPDRHLIEVGESLETFIKRLHTGGMTPEQVSHRTSAPPEKVRRILSE